MAAKNADEGDLSESDIEFFRRELKSREPSQLTLITGTGDEAQKVLRDMIDAGASIQDAKLSDKHEAAVDGKNMKIKQTIRIEESMEEATCGGNINSKTIYQILQVNKRFIDLTIADDMEQIDFVKELNTVIYTTDLKDHIDDTFQIADFSLKELRTEDYPKNSQPRLNKAAFYCRKAREYRAKASIATTDAGSYEGDEKEINELLQVSQEIEKDFSEVFAYCLQEAIFWKLKAEIYSKCEQDKKRIKDPTKCSTCHIQSPNGVTKYVYIPTNGRNIEESEINLELTKVGLGVRNRVNNVVLVLKKIEECKEQNTLDTIVLLGINGAPFKDRGTIIVRERCNVGDWIKSNEYLDIFKHLGNEKRIFSYDQNDPKMQTELQEFFKQTRPVTSGRCQNTLTETGMKLYRKLAAVNKGMEFQVNKDFLIQVSEAINQMNKLRACDKLLIELKKVQNIFGRQMEEIKKGLDSCDKDHLKYSPLKVQYEDLSMTERKLFYDDNPENFLKLIQSAISSEKDLLFRAVSLTEELKKIPGATPIILELAFTILKDIGTNPVKATATVAGIGATTLGGAGIGGTIGLLGGPIGVVVGGAIGAAAGGAVGAVGATIGYITAKLI